LGATAMSFPQLNMEERSRAAAQTSSCFSEIFGERQ
jgi:hypothetical protein